LTAQVKNILMVYLSPFQHTAEPSIPKNQHSKHRSSLVKKKSRLCGLHLQCLYISSWDRSACRN